MLLPPYYRWFDPWVAGSAMPMPEELEDLAVREGIGGLVRLETAARSRVTPE